MMKKQTLYLDKELERRYWNKPHTLREWNNLKIKAEGLNTAAFERLIQTN